MTTIGQGQVWWTSVSSFGGGWSVLRWGSVFSQRWGGVESVVEWESIFPRGWGRDPRWGSVFSGVGWRVLCSEKVSSLGGGVSALDPFTPERDQVQISPAALPVIFHGTLKNMAFHSLLRWQTIVLPNSHCITHTFLYKGLGECTFWTWGLKG